MKKIAKFSEIQYSEQVDYLLLWIESASLKLVKFLKKLIIICKNLFLI